MLESYFVDNIKSVPQKFGKIPEGSWIMSYKVVDKKIWNMIKDKKLAEQAEQLEQNKAKLRTMALLLSNSGMSVEEIANSVGMPQDQVKLLLNK